MLNISPGNGGWVCAEVDGLPGLLYVRLRAAVDGRLRASEVYLDASQEKSDITQAHMRGIPLTRIEATMNQVAEAFKRDAAQPGPDLSTLATYFNVTAFVSNDPRNVAARNWAHDSLASQNPELVKKSGVKPIQRAPRKPAPFDGEDFEFRLDAGPSADGLTDEFLAAVARAYTAAFKRGEPPNVAISEQTGYGVRTVQRWVYTARQRGLMPRGRQGQVG
jgi:hypothetical protein